MSTAEVLLPLLIQVLLTFFVGIGTAYQRTLALNSGQTHFRDIALREPNWPPRALQFAYSFSNQFEMPVLFYVLTVLALITKLADFTFVVMAWLFVATRIVQAAIHITNNNVRYRGMFFGIGGLVLIVMWIIFMVRVLWVY